jgi:ring-1,2-phenylacetyl-CoA epoxidase subunit PaaD
MTHSPDGAASGDEARVRTAWCVLSAVPDPELPALTIADLGIVRFVKVAQDGVLHAGLSPTYTGCPASDHIGELAERALRDANIGSFIVKRVLAPAWSSDWVTAEGRRKLQEYGIVPPRPSSVSGAAPVACPRCGSLETESLSEFGSTPCKALHRCRECLEPFERFKCI